MPSQTRFAIDIRGIEEVQRHFADAPNKVEGGINKFMHGTGADSALGAAEPKIRKLIPVSEGPPARWSSHAPHAKSVPKWYGYSISAPLTLVIRFSKAQWYLRFPETGTGTSRKKGPGDFLVNGTDAALPELMSGMARSIMHELGE